MLRRCMNINFNDNFTIQLIFYSILLDKKYYCYEWFYCFLSSLKLENELKKPDWKLPKYLSICFYFLTVSPKNRTLIRALDLRKNEPPKKSTRWKNQLSRNKNVAICLKSYEKQCWSDSFSYKKKVCKASFSCK